MGGQGGCGIFKTTEIKSFLLSLEAARVPREAQVRALVEAGARPSQVVQVARRKEDGPSILHVLGLHALLSGQGGWEATRSLALELDLHPLAFALAWAEGYSDQAVLRRLGLQDRFTAAPDALEEGVPNPVVPWRISAMRLGAGGSAASPGGQTEALAFVDVLETPFPQPLSLQVTGSSRPLAVSCQKTSLTDGPLIVGSLSDLALEGDPRRISALRVRGRRAR